MNPRKTELAQISPTDIAAHLCLPVNRLWQIARNNESFFHPPRSKRIGSKNRTLDVPRKWHKKRLKKVHKLLASKIIFPKPAHGGVKGRSCRTSALRHLNREAVIKRDVKNCFPAIDSRKFYRQLLRMGLRIDTARLLSLLMTVRNRVPQGSPTSNDALNLYLWLNDNKLQKMVAEQGGKYTRYADDITVSTNVSEKIESIGTSIEQSIEDNALKINQDKKDYDGLRLINEPQEVQGFLVNSKKGLQIPTAKRDAAREDARSFVRASRCVQPSSLVAVAKKREALVGTINYQAQAEINDTKHLRKQLRAGERLVQKRLERDGLNAQAKRWWKQNKKRTLWQQLAKTWQNRQTCKS